MGLELGIVDDGNVVGEVVGEEVGRADGGTVG